jgi:hypothetical protein
MLARVVRLVKSIGGQHDHLRILQAPAPEEWTEAGKPAAYAFEPGPAFVTLRVDREDAI